MISTSEDHRNTSDAGDGFLAQGGVFFPDLIVAPQLIDQLLSRSFVVYFQLWDHFTTVCISRPSITKLSCIAPCGY